MAGGVCARPLRCAWAVLVGSNNRRVLLVASAARVVSDSSHVGGEITHGEGEGIGSRVEAIWQYPQTVVVDDELVAMLESNERTGEVLVHVEKSWSEAVKEWLVQTLIEKKYATRTQKEAYAEMAGEDRAKLLFEQNYAAKIPWQPKAVAFNKFEGEPLEALRTWKREKGKGKDKKGKDKDKGKSKGRGSDWNSKQQGDQGKGKGKQYGKSSSDYGGKAHHSKSMS